MSDDQVEESKAAKRTATEVPSTRNSRKRIKTRALLLKAAYEVMSTRGVDEATIQEITERADVGFGTFYNYFSSKDDLAGYVLDCVINDLGRRNDLATAHLRLSDPARVMPVSIRLTLRDAIADPMWKWWVLRPDLLADRMREGFKIFATRDIRDAIKVGVYLLNEQDIDTAWGIAVWMMVGALRDIVIGHYSQEHEQKVVEMIMRVMGVSATSAREVATGQLPVYPAPNIDFDFQLVASQQE
ncbi:MAG: helix-turn-helix domain containing protein [Proteobacteria bacterium]|nr:helix-turn-helix domain containing protein [Pseudomonadota bacterium]